MADRLDDIRRDIASLNKRLETTLSGEEADEVRQALERVSGRVIQTSRQLTMPVMVPASSNMTPRLVPVHILTQLDINQTVSNITLTFSGLCLGGLIGVLTNCVTGGQLTPAAGVFVVAF